MHKRIFLILFLSLFTLVAHNQTRSLDYYLKEGYQNSPLLNDFRNQAGSAITDSLLIKASRKPFIEARSELLYSPFYNNFGYDEVITDGGSYMAVMGVSQNIFNKREIENKFESVNIKTQGINNSSRLSLNELNKTITEQYLASFSDYREFIFNKTFLDLLLKELEIVKRFIINGAGKQTDYLALLVEEQTQEILVNQLKSQYRKDLSLLNQFCGLNDSAFYELKEPRIEIKGAPDISKTPSYIQFKIDSLRIDNERRAVDIRYKPRISWFADAGILTSNPWNFYKHFGYSAGLSLSIPVYDGKQRELEKQKLELDENSRQAYEIHYRTQYLQQVQQLNDELKSLNEMTLRMENQLTTSDQLVKALKDQLESGIILMTDYINAVKNYRITSRNLNLANIRKLQLINEINILLTQ